MVSVPVITTRIYCRKLLHEFIKCHIGSEICKIDVKKSFELQASDISKAQMFSYLCFRVSLSFFCSISAVMTIKYKVMIIVETGLA